MSLLRNHYPGTVFRNGERLLWNPILKKAFKNLPEERVRLRAIDFLLRDAGWPKNRISCEKDIRTATATTTAAPTAHSGRPDGGRTDVVCYDNRFRPAVLIECKAPSVPLDEKTALQISRYNRQISAPYLMLTNGVIDLFFRVSAGGGNPVPAAPQDLFEIKNEPAERDFHYFIEKGFAGENTRHEHQSFYLKLLHELYYNENGDHQIRFLDAGQIAGNRALSQYYRIFDLQKKKKLAVSLSSTEKGETIAFFILNENGINVDWLVYNPEKESGMREVIREKDESNILPAAAEPVQTYKTGKRDTDKNSGVSGEHQAKSSLVTFSETHFSTMPEIIRKFLF